VLRDLPIAIGLLCATGVVNTDNLKKLYSLGELLSLDGEPAVFCRLP